jgi:hypothetical protein
MTFLDRHDLGVLGAALIASALLTAEMGYARIRRRDVGGVPDLVPSPTNSR